MTKGVLLLKLHRERIRDSVPALPNPHFEPMIELISNREAIIEGCNGIVEYNDCVATVNCRLFLLKFEGFDISLNSLSDNCISVKGRFTCVSYSML